MTPKITKIAIVIPKYGLVGGGELFASELTEILAENPTLDIHVFANKWKVLSNNITFHKVPIISFPKWLTTISFAYFANKLIANMNFDLIHTHDRIFHADIFTMHGIPHRTWVKEIRKKQMSLFDRGTSWTEQKLVTSGNCKKFLSVSHLAQEKFLEEYNVNHNMLEVLHPGLNIGKFQAASNPQVKKEIREQFNLNMDDKVILFVSMNFAHKGLDILMSSLARLNNDKLKLLVVGKGNQTKYTKLAQKLGIGTRVIFTGVINSHIEKIYSAVDIFVMLSKFDTFGMSVLEAMAASKPVLISNTVGAKDIVENGKNGFIVDPLDEKTICASILTLLADETYAKMATEARQTAQLYSWDSMAKRVEKIYSDVLHESLIHK